MLNGIQNISNLFDDHAESRSISPENFTGEKGNGGMATEGPAKECARELGQGWKISPHIFIKPGETFVLAEIDGPGEIQHIWMTDDCTVNRSMILRFYWDDSKLPSIETPHADFFASADYQTYRQLTSLPVCVNPRRGFNCYWPMPFYKKCRITLENITDRTIVVYYQIDYILTELPKGQGYFHAQFRRMNPLPKKEVYTILDHVHGNGRYVGTYLFWSPKVQGWWGEGEIKFYLDGDREFPTICGTGTEDYFCGSYGYFVGEKYMEYCTPYAGLSKVLGSAKEYSEEQRFSMYRWHICDEIRFRQDIRVTIQALGWQEDGKYLLRQDDISSVAFWYQDSICEDFPTLPAKDFLQIK